LKIIEVAIDIYNRYIKIGSEREINIDYQQKTTLKNFFRR